jgi:hypothetical protein
MSSRDFGGICSAREVGDSHRLAPLGVGKPEKRFNGVLGILPFT